MIYQNKSPLENPLKFTSDEMSNEEYHKSDGVSNTGLGDIAKSPAVYQWRKNAPEDPEKLKALDIGTALHTRLLEPHLFDEQFAVEPKLDRRTKAGKQEAEIFAMESEGKKILTMEEGRKLDFMVESTYAHSAARFLLEADGQCESLIFWTDRETGELCRVRPDRMLDDRPIIVDVKKTADINKFSKSIYEYRYNVQAAMYSDGYKQYFDEDPIFAFLVVSETIECGKYPVRVFSLDDNAFSKGWELYRKNLEAYHECVESGNWGGFEMIGLPGWVRD